MEAHEVIKMLKGAKRWLTAIGLSTALLLSSSVGFSNKAYAAKQQYQQQQAQQTQEAQPQTRQVVVGAPCNTWFVFTTYEEYKNQKEDINLLCDYLNLSIELLEKENKGLDTKEVCIKRKSLEERVEKILNGHLNSMLTDIYPMQNKQSEDEIKIGVDIIDTNSSITIADRNGTLLYNKTFNKAFSRSTLKKLDDLAEFLGPNVIEKWGYQFDVMSDKEVVKKIDELIEQAKKENNGKLERKYKSYAHYLGGYTLPWDHIVRITNRTYELSDIILICGHEYGHILHAGFPVSRKYEGEQKTLQETICDLLGGETSLRYPQRYLRGDLKRYKRYMKGVAQGKVDIKMWKDLIKKVDKLLAEGQIDKAEKLMDKTAKKYGIIGINQANLAIAKLYYSNGDGKNKEEKKEGGTRNKLEYMLKELSPDYLIETTKYITNFNELDYAYRLIKEINKKDKKELKKSYIENQEAIKKLEGGERTQNPFSNPLGSDQYIDNQEALEALKEFMGEAHKYTYYRYIPHTWEQRKEFVRKSILLHELYERLPEKEVAEIIKEKVAEK